MRLAVGHGNSWKGLFRDVDNTVNFYSTRDEVVANGDVCVTTNGVAAYLLRELPFAHNGFGQDDEWVVANFTNATEILAVGYPQWVDAQVGTGLTNGLYKLTVAVDCDPPETTQISVGDLSIAVTNAGEYVFLITKARCIHNENNSTNCCHHVGYCRVVAFCWAYLRRDEQSNQVNARSAPCLYSSAR